MLRSSRKSPLMHPQQQPLGTLGPPLARVGGGRGIRWGVTVLFPEWGHMTGSGGAPRTTAAGGSDTLRTSPTSRAPKATQNKSVTDLEIRGHGDFFLNEGN